MDDDYIRDDVADDWEAEMAEEAAREEEEAREREAKKVKIQLKTVAEQLKAREAEELAQAAALQKDAGGVSEDAKAVLAHARELAARNAQLSDLAGEDLNAKEWPFPTTEQEHADSGAKMALHVEQNIGRNLVLHYLDKLTASLLVTMKSDQLDVLESAIKAAKIGSRKIEAPVESAPVKNADIFDVVEDKGGACVTETQADEMDW